jgi:hypothetical protein
MNQYVFELPWVLEIEVIIHQFIAPIHQRLPVSVVTSHRLNIVSLDLKASFVVYLVTLHQPCLRILESPSHACDHS